MSLRLPAQPFLGASPQTHPTVVLFGAPLDLTESFRAGTAEAPQRIRAVSDVLETFSPELDADLCDLRFADWGDLPLTGTDIMAHWQDAIAATVERIARTEALPIMLGGEHTVTVGAVKALHLLFPDLAVLQLDAHTDLRDQYEGVAMSHATVMRRIAEEVGLGSIVQLGIRSGTRDEFDMARGCLWSGRDLILRDSALGAVRRRPIYLTVDIDVLDPSCAPGTGCPEPGGATFSDVLSVVHSLRHAQVVGFDVTEVLPSADVNDITSIAAAKLVRDAALAFAKRPSKPEL